MSYCSTSFSLSGANVPGAKVTPMVLSLLGAKVKSESIRGNESSSYHKLRTYGNMVTEGGYRRTLCHFYYS